MSKITKEMRDALRAPLPPDAIKPHPTKTYLSSIKAIYVTERFNDVFGVGGWQLRTNMVERSEGGTVVVKTVLEIPEYGVYYESFGGNDNGGSNSKNFDLGDAYKGAVTDAITKIASYMEIAIDVFKGKSTPPAPKATTTPKPPAAKEPDKKELDWLNPGTPNWEYSVKRLREGVTIETIKKNFRISESNLSKLTKEANETATLS